jgi:hypothetical protein
MTLLDPGPSTATPSQIDCDAKDEFSRANSAKANPSVDPKTNR